MLVLMMIYNLYDNTTARRVEKLMEMKCNYAMGTLKRKDDESDVNKRGCVVRVNSGDMLQPGFFRIKFYDVLLYA